MPWQQAFLAEIKWLYVLLKQIWYRYQVHVWRLQAVACLVESASATQAFIKKQVVYSMHAMHHKLAALSIMFFSTYDEFEGKGGNFHAHHLGRRPID